METFWLQTPAGKPRARSLGIPFGGTPGRWNAITDVPNVEVGYATLIEGTDVRTGVTAIHPRGRADPGDPCVAGYHSQNGNGEMTGVSWVSESGTMAGPICVTNTHAVGIAHGGIVRWTAKHHPAIAEAWLLPVAGETWDGYLNDINGGHVTVDTAVAALEAARSGPIEEGSVGGGTGMNCYAYKGGSTTASRVVEYGGIAYTIGVFLQANFGARAELVVAGSCIAIVATDAPLLPDQCRALARRVALGLARTGTAGSHFSGDLFLALSTANRGAITPGAKSLYGEGRGRLDQLSFIPWGFLDPFYEGVVQAVEEAVVDVLVVNDEMVGFRGHRTPGFPNDRAVALLRARGAIT
jgi:L-aminopeptidase/D-esterase-like protein